MKKSEEKNKVYATLSLPIIEMNSKVAYFPESYEESGSFFVQSSDGKLCIVDVDKENGVVSYDIITTNAKNMLMKDVVTTEVSEQINERLQRLEDVVCSATQQVIDCTECAVKSAGETLYKMDEQSNENTTLLKEIVQALATFKNEQSQSPLNRIGYISQDTLLDIIRTVSK